VQKSHTQQIDVDSPSGASADGRNYQEPQRLFAISGFGKARCKYAAAAENPIAPPRGK
jgi:hypothetical protein